MRLDDSWQASCFNAGLVQYREALSQGAVASAVETFVSVYNSKYARASWVLQEDCLLRADAGVSRRNQIEGQMNLRDAVRRDISYKDPKSGKPYQLKPKVC